MTQDLKTSAFNNQGLVLIAALGMTLSLITPVFAQQHSFIIDLSSKQVTDLGSLGGGGTRAYDINDVGQVVGSSRTPNGETRAFMTGPDGIGMKRVGASADSLYNDYDAAVAINNSAQVVGNYPLVSDPEGFHYWLRSFVTGPNGAGVKELGFAAEGINDSGVIVGWVNSNNPFSSAAYGVITTGGNGAVRINGLFGPYDDNDSFKAINNLGQIVGNSSYVSSFVTSVIVADGTDPVNTTTSLLPLTGNHASDALAINDKGEVVGVIYLKDESHPFFINGDYTDFTDLGTLGGSKGEALGLNEAGQVVGWADTVEGNRTLL